MNDQLTFAGPALSSDEGLPLANGLMGALIWGDGAPLKISVDRTDLWDLRPIPEYDRPDYTYDNVIALHKAGDDKALIDLLEKPYHRAGPTKIPAGRIEIRFSDNSLFQNAALDLTQAVATTKVGKHAIKVRVDANQIAGLIEIDTDDAQLRLIVPPFGGRPVGWEAPVGFDASNGDVWDLGYAPPEVVNETECTGFSQACYGDFIFAVCLVQRSKNGILKASWSIATSEEADDVR